MAICRRTVNLLDSTGSAMNEYSDPAQGDSFYGYTDGLHTIQVVYDEFVGRLRIQCTLSLSPTDDDWFDIIPDITTGDTWNEEGYIQFSTTSPPTRISEAYTFRGNYTFVRVYMDRTYMADGVTYDSSYGQILKAIMSY